MDLNYKNELNNDNNLTLIAFYTKMLDYNFDSFLEIISRSPSFDDLDFYITNTIREDSDVELIKKLLRIFPFYFFEKISKSQRESIITLFDDKKKFKNQNELVKLFEFSFNVLKMIESLKKLEKEGYSFDYPRITTTIYQALLKYAFFTLSNCVKIEAVNTVIELFQEYSRIKKKVLQKVPHKMYLRYFNNTICNLCDNPMSFIENRKLFIEERYFSKIIFSAIYYNIRKGKSNLSASKRNMLLRPIYFELICKMFFKDLYQMGQNDKEVVKKLKDTITYLEFTPSH
jgi:hypothetical protein